MTYETIDLASSGQLLREAKPEEEQHQELDQYDADKALVWHACITRLKVAKEYTTPWPADLWGQWIEPETPGDTDPKSIQIISKHWTMTMRGPDGPVTIRSSHAQAPNMDEADTIATLRQQQQPQEVASLNDIVNLMRESRYGSDALRIAQSNWDRLRGFMAYQANFTRGIWRHYPERFAPDFDQRLLTPGMREPTTHTPRVNLRIADLLARNHLPVSDLEAERLQTILQSTQIEMRPPEDGRAWRRLVLKMIAKTHPDLAPGNEDLCKILTHLLNEIDENSKPID